MISLILKKINTFDKNNEITQEVYDAYIDQLDLDQLKCSCQHDHCLSKHAYYHRKIKSCSGTFSLRVLRVKCSHCNRTHAILLSSIIPYSQILFKQLLLILKNPMHALDPLMISHDIDEAHLRAIKKKFSLHWKKRLLNMNLDLNEQLSSFCFLYFKRQFMQIRNTINIPFYL